LDKNKYLIGLIGLAVGFMISFLLTTNYNKNNAQVSASGQSAAMPGATGAGGPANQQAMMGQVQQAIEKAKNNPKDFQAQLDAAKVYYQVNRLPDTVEYLKKAYEINPGEFTKQSGNELKGALGFIGVYYSDQKNYDEAEAWFRRALEASPGDPEVRIELASTFIQRQPPAPDKAIQELQAVLKSNPKDGHALSHLVEAYALKKDARGAEEAFNSLKEAEPTNQRLTALQGMVSDLKAGKQVSIPKE
jgi:tetratricopeptide (TPR) repeat protein